MSTNDNVDDQSMVAADKPILKFSQDKLIGKGVYLCWVLSMDSILYPNTLIVYDVFAVSLRIGLYL
jgi:hypothetical protein